MWWYGFTYQIVAVNIVMKENEEGVVYYELHPKNVTPWFPSLLLSKIGLVTSPLTNHWISSGMEYVLFIKYFRPKGYTNYLNNILKTDNFDFC